MSGQDVFASWRLDGRTALVTGASSGLGRHFAGLLARVRRWARARQVDSGAWGLLGGFSWAILAAWAARDAGERGVAREPWPLLRHFFATFAGWQHGKAVAFGTPPQAPPGRRTQWPIWTPTAPAFQHYFTGRDFSTSAVGPDLGPEIIRFIQAESSPTGAPMLVIANEISGTVNLVALAAN